MVAEVWIQSIAVIKGVDIKVLLITWVAFVGGDWGCLVAGTGSPCQLQNRLTATHSLAQPPCMWHISEGIKKGIKNTLWKKELEEKVRNHGDAKTKMRRWGGQRIYMSKLQGYFLKEPHPMKEFHCNRFVFQEGYHQWRHWSWEKCMRRKNGKDEVLD